MNSIKVTSKDKGQRIDKYIRKYLNDAPLSFIYKLFRKKDIKVNGKKVEINYILQENDYEMIFVANFYRPLTRTADQAIEVMKEIELACGIKFTAIINNSNLGKDTTAKTVENTLKIAEELSNKTGLPIIYTTCTEQVAQQLKVPNLMQITLQEKYFDVKEN